MTLLSSITSVAEECGYTVDTRVITSTDTTTVELRAMANRIIKEIGEAYDWPVLYKSGAITLTSAQSLYALPGDFSFYHHDTFWNSSTRWPMYGPLSPQDYADIQGYGLTATTYSQFQIRGIADNQFYIYPTPSATGNIATYQYMSARYVRPQTWTVAIVFAASAYCFYNGNYYQNSSGTTLSGGSAPTHTSGTVGFWAYYSGTYTSFLADTDEPLFSSRIFEQGLLERYAEIKDLPVKPRFQDQLNEEFSRKIPGSTIYVSSYDYDFVLQARSGTAVFGKPLGS